MKRSNWLLVGLVAVCLVILPLAGCGTSCDFKDFSSLDELEEWLVENDVSEKPVTEYAEDWYRRALEVQSDALADGYVVSVDYDVMEDGESMTVWCTAVVGGRVFYWDPETDEVYEEYSLGTVR
jgi:hypothetical protein